MNHADGRRGRQTNITKLIVSFRSFANAPEKRKVVAYKSRVLKIPSDTSCPHFYTFKRKHCPLSTHCRRCEKKSTQHSYVLHTINSKNQHIQGYADIHLSHITLWKPGDVAMILKPRIRCELIRRWEISKEEPEYFQFVDSKCRREETESTCWICGKEPTRSQRVLEQV